MSLLLNQGIYVIWSTEPPASGSLSAFLSLPQCASVCVWCSYNGWSLELLCGCLVTIPVFASLPPGESPFPSSLPAPIVCREPCSGPCQSPLVRYSASALSSYWLVNTKAMDSFQNPHLETFCTSLLLPPSCSLYTPPLPVCLSFFSRYSPPERERKSTHKTLSCPDIFCNIFKSISGQLRLFTTIFFAALSTWKFHVFVFPLFQNKACARKY